MTINLLLSNLQQKFPALHFSVGKQFCWSPKTNEIFYNLKAGSEDKLMWSLLHETGHAILEHHTYEADYELIRLEVAAWRKATTISAELGIEIENDHIQDCLDTYRDWLYKRSICPRCTTKCLQQGDFAHYRCFNCHTVWSVTPSLFCRSYRTTKTVNQTSAVFHQLEGYPS